MASLAANHQAVGEREYRLGNFNAALLEFNKAIDAGNGNAINLRVLDARCGTYEKLGKVESALRDARQMIKHVPCDPRGYLRAGRLLVRMNKYEKAYEIYTRGFPRISASNPKRQVIEELSQQLSAKINAKKQLVDPFRMLPTETASLVLRQLDFFSVVTCIRVCKEWKRLIGSLPELWHTVDFSRAKRLVQIGEVRACIRNTNSKCRKVVLKRVTDPNRNLLNLVMIRCPELEHLETEIGLSSPERALGAQRLRTLILSGSDACRTGDIQNVVSKCPNLERAEFYAVVPDYHRQWTTSLEKLKLLRLSAFITPVRFSLGALRGLFEMAPNIEELYLANWSLCSMAASERNVLDTSRYTDLRVVEFKNLEVSGEMPRMPSSIEDLTIANCTFLPAWQTSGTPSTSEMTNLKTLRLKSNHKLPFSWLDATMHSSMGSIESLDLSGFVHINMSDLIYYMTQGWFEKLKDLRLAYMDVRDDIISQLVKHAKNLEVIDLSHTAVTGIAIKELVLTEMKLWRIILLHCQNVAYDAVEFARAREVKVDYLFPDNKKRKYTRRFQG